MSKAWAWFNRQSPKTKTAIVVGFVLLTGIACVQAAMEERRKAEEAAYRREVYNSPEARAERAAKLEALRNRLIAERREKRGKAWEEVVGRELMIRIFATLVDGKGEDDQHCAQCNVIIKEILAIFMLRLESGDMTARRGDLWAEQAAQNAYSAFIEEYIPVGIRLDAEYLCGAKREPAPIDMVGLR